jgi:suppressor for copper-sensitivity B
MIKFFLLSLFLIFSSYASDKPVNFILDCNKSHCNLKLQILDGWKVYSHSPGEETSLEIKLLEPRVENFSINWDEIEVIEAEFSGIKALYYKNLSPIKINFLTKNDTFILPLEVNYAACKEHCIFLSEKIYYESPINLIWLLLTSFLGGLLLNFMPCILPILGLKILSIKKRKENLFYLCLGFLTSFLLLAFITVIFREIGITLGWGFHFHEPIFLALAATILGLASLNLFGLITIPSKFNFQEPKTDFLKGIFLVLIATPCTAPFLGPALALATTQETRVILLIYLAIGLGFSLPYLLLMIAPYLIKLPKNGNWTIYIKKILAIPFIFSSLWFLFLLSQEDFYLLTISIIIIILPLILHNLRYFLLLIFIIPLLFLLKNSDKKRESIDFNQMHQLIKENKQFLVNITSDWCLTCKVNEEMILKNPEIESKLRKAGVIIIRGDYTRGSKEITNYIKSHKRSGIPLTIVYGPAKPEGILLPVLFSEKDLFTALEKSKGTK